MENKNEIALTNELTRLKHIHNEKSKLEEEYIRETGLWLAKKAKYLYRIEQMDKSLKSGEEYVNKILQNKKSE